MCAGAVLETTWTFGAKEGGARANDLFPLHAHLWTGTNKSVYDGINLFVVAMILPFFASSSPNRLRITLSDGRPFFLFFFTSESLFRVWQKFIDLMNGT